MKTRRTIYTKKDFNNVIIPSWQRWTNQNNVKDLAEAVLECGQLRDILVCITEDGTKILTDGKHLKLCFFDIIKAKKANVLEVFVKDEEEARQTFISFNTRGRTLKNIDYVVSYAGSGNIEYKKFLTQVMKSPNNLKEAEKAHGKLFTIPSLIKIFLGESNRVKKGKSKLPKNFDRLVEVVEYVGENYLCNGKLLAHTKKNGNKMKLNGGSIISVFETIKQNENILSMTNNEIKNMLVDYTIYHYNSMIYPSFTKDVVADSFKTYEKERLYL
jgi:hypothetical protein